MRLNEIETRLSDIKSMVDSDQEFNLDEIEKEVDSLKEERQAILDKAEQRKKELADVLTGTGAIVIEKVETETRNMENEKVYGIDSMEYRNAFWKKLSGQALSEVEERAFTHTTANSEIALPVETVNTIWSLIEEKHPILNDITLYRTGTVLELTKHTAIAAGDAKTVAEGVANDDEENTFVKVTLSGKDFSKHVEVSYALDIHAPQLEGYLTTEIANRLGKALADDVVAEIQAGMAEGNQVESTAVKEVTFKELAGLFGALAGAGQPVVYTSNASLYGYLVSMVDASDRPLFQPSLQANAQGVLLGAQVKLEDSVPANLILVGDPKAVVGNMVQDIMIEKDKDIKRHVNIYSGYARFECELMNDKAFAQLTVKQA